MVKHIILFTLKEDVDKQAAIRTAASAMEPLVGRIPGLLRLEVREAFCGPDFVLYSEFDSRDSLNGYADHPLHIEAKKTFFHLLAARTPADYEV